MFRLLMAILSLTSINTLAQTELPKLTIKEVKEAVARVNPAETCVDEYLKRRKQLIIQLSVSPAVAVAGTMASTYVGGMTAVGIANATGVSGWSGLGYVIVGGAAGAVAGAGVVVADATATGITLANNVLITKAVTEQHLDSPGYYSDRLYEKYLRKSDKDVSKEDFINTLLNADSDGTLCDGTMVKQPKFKIGPKLKYEVAKLKDLVRFVDSK